MLFLIWLKGTIMATDNLVKEFYDSPDHPASFSGINKIYRNLQENKENKKTYKVKDIKRLLEKQETYQIYKKPLKRFPRNKVITSYINDQWDMDLIDMVPFSDANSGYKYLLTALDLFSRKAYIRPLKSRKQEDIYRAIVDLFKTQHPSKLRTDKEFQGTKLKKLFADKGITHFVTQNSQIKANYVERFNGTIRNKIFKYLYHNNTHRYLDVLNDLVKSYNSTYHRTIGMKPEDVTVDNQHTLWAKQYLKAGTKKIKKGPFFKYNIGDYVRLNYHSNVFTRDFDQKWTGEIFKIVKRYPRQGLPIYKIVDYDGDPIIGTFMEQEMQKVDMKKDNIFKVDKILKSKIKKGESGIWYLGYFGLKNIILGLRTQI